MPASSSHAAFDGSQYRFLEGQLLAFSSLLMNLSATVKCIAEKEEELVMWRDLYQLILDENHKLHAAAVQMRIDLQGKDSTIQRNETTIELLQAEIQRLEASMGLTELARQDGGRTGHVQKQEIEVVTRALGD